MLQFSHQEHDSKLYIWEIHSIEMRDKTARLFENKNLWITTHDSMNTMNIIIIDCDQNFSRGKISLGSMKYTNI